MDTTRLWTVAQCGVLTRTVRFYELVYVLVVLEFTYKAVSHKLTVPRVRAGRLCPSPCIVLA